MALRYVLDTRGVDRLGALLIISGAVIGLVGLVVGFVFGYLLGMGR